jgi:mannose-6-phosphate isomerase-like protein (cupin superfamily)
MSMSAGTPCFVCDLNRGLELGPPPPGNLAIPLFRHGSLELELYAPVGRDAQRPHARDEVYVVARGRGQFFDGEQRHAVQQGTCIFVAAGRVHRFEDFSADFAVWVAFYGPAGGERDADAIAAARAER